MYKEKQKTSQKQKWQKYTKFYFIVIILLLICGSDGSGTDSGSVMLMLSRALIKGIRETIPINSIFWYLKNLQPRKERTIHNSLR